jgi:hypothetical protein
LVGYLENLNSDRKIINHASMRMDVLFFIGYDMDEELPRLYFKSRKYTAKETIAAPKHIPVPIRRTISTPRIFVQAGLLSMAKRFMTPKKVSKKKMRGNLRLLFIDCFFNCSSDSRFDIKI